MAVAFKVKRANIAVALVATLLPAAHALAAPEPAGWYAGDPHVHRSCGGSPEAISSMQQRMSTNDLAAISLLADMGNAEVQDAVQDLPRVNGQNDPVSTSTRIVHWDAEWHWDPIYFQYDHQALGGHVVALGVSEAHQIWQEYTKPIFDWAHAAGGIAGFAHMQYLDDGIPQTLSCCGPIEYPVEVALGSSDFISEDVVTAGATWSGMNPDAAMNAYYRLLNTGFRPGFAAGTDYPCNSGQALGGLLTYVQVAGGQMTYDGWVDGIARGRTVVSRNGHAEFLDLVVNGTARPGDQVDLAAAGTLPVTVTWTANQSLSGTIELVSNGVVVASQAASVTASRGATISASVSFPRSGWIVARRMGTSGHVVHTAAVFVLVGGAPIRASAADAGFYMSWMDNLLQKTSPGGEWNSYFPTSLSAAQARYQAAKQVFQQIKAEAEAANPPPTGSGGSIWSASAAPSVADGGPDSPVELGVRFRSDVAGKITGVRFYKSTANTGTHVANLWSSTGTNLATATFTGETASGWQQVLFATPVSITAGTAYVASYHTNVGHYAADQDSFASSGVDAPPLHAPADAGSAPNGVFAYGSTSAFPSNGWNSTNYWVDVVFAPAATLSANLPDSAEPVRAAGGDAAARRRRDVLRWHHGRRDEPGGLDVVGAHRRDGQRRRARHCAHAGRDDRLRDAGRRHRGRHAHRHGRAARRVHVVSRRRDPGRRVLRDPRRDGRDAAVRVDPRRGQRPAGRARPRVERRHLGHADGARHHLVHRPGDRRRGRRGRHADARAHRRREADERDPLADQRRSGARGQRPGLAGRARRAVPLGRGGHDHGGPVLQGGGEHRHARREPVVEHWHQARDRDVRRRDGLGMAAGALRDARFDHRRDHLRRVLPHERRPLRRRPELLRLVGGGRAAPARAGERRLGAERRVRLRLRERVPERRLEVDQLLGGRRLRAGGGPLRDLP